MMWKLAVFKYRKDEAKVLLNVFEFPSKEEAEKERVALNENFRETKFEEGTFLEADYPRPDHYNYPKTYTNLRDKSLVV